WPARARVDAALESGQRVGTFYDPMLGKVIVSGTTREAARRALVNALDDTAVLGLTTNLGFLRQLAASDAYRDCEIDTGWLDSHPDAFVLETPIPAWCLAAWSLAVAHDGDPRHPFGANDGWRAGGEPAAVPIELTADDTDTRVLSVDVAAGVITGPHRTVAVRPLAEEGERVRLELDDEVHEGHVLVTSGSVLVGYHGQSYVFERPDAFGPGGSAAAGDGSVTAPMPGTVLAVHVAVGTTVAEGDTLGVLEAMKMELALKAPFAGVVTEVDAEVGGQVDLGRRLFIVGGHGGEG
ncbi:MAG: carbamoyl-phosphate synthase subunit L, partial [Nocardioidaceae bacterium]|nr:carbamoyl-phosphate synthase subunit L [Nocardioidaceae bacterium]